MEVVSNVDVFISYQHESETIVKKIVDALENNNIKCWYAPRNIISGSYAKSICDGIGKCKVFLLVLSEEASNSQHVLNEVELAYKRLDSGIILMPFKITSEITNEEMNYYINRLQWIDAVNIPLEKAINDLLAKIKPLFGITDGENVLTPTVRATNKYFKFEDAVEVERLKCEDALLYDIESNIYDKLFFNRDDLNVLDANVLYAGSQARRLYRKEVKYYMGLCYTEDAVEAYNNLYPQENSKYYFINFNDNHFELQIKKYMNEMGITGFDLINISMLILDLKDPLRVLSKLRRFLNPNGMIYIRDIDDGVNLYYPDEKGLFKKYFELAGADKYSGFRYSGRQIYSYLKEIEAKEIKLELCGLSTIGMDYEQKQNYFQSYFTFLQNEYGRLLKEEPENKKYIEAYNWLEENMWTIEESFFKSDFFFNGGYIIITAKF